MMLRLNCLSLDDPSKGHFPVYIDSCRRASALADSVYEMLESFYNSCRVQMADLWLYLPSDLLVEPTSSLAERAKEAQKSARRLTPPEELSLHFPHEPDGTWIHILASAEEISLSGTILAARSASPPSEAALPDRISSQQAKYPIYNGRPDSKQGPPIAIYNSAFGKLKGALEDMSNIEVTAQELRAAHLLLTMSVEFYYYEGHRMEQTDMRLEKLLGFSIVNTAPGDGLIRTYVGEQRVVLACLRWKNELGSEGDAGYHASCAYREYVTDSEYDEICKRTCCPAVVIGIMGPYLCIMGGVFTGEIIVQPFTDYLFLGGGPDYGKRVLHVARMFKATRKALLDLERYYETSLTKDSSYEALLPQPAVIDESNPCPDLRYVDELFPENPASTLYRAKMNDRDVIVKFTSSYCGDAHRFLARQGLAPALHFCGRIHGGLWMVVMDYVSGKESNDFLTEHGGLPHEIAGDIKRAIDLLHENGFVFGDLRAQNILIVEKSEVETNGNPQPLTEYGLPSTVTSGQCVTPRLGAILVDFDWCGKDSESRYPTTLNDTGEIDWAPGVERFGVMKKEHDDYRLHRLGILEAPEG